MSEVVGQIIEVVQDERKEDPRAGMPRQSLAETVGRDERQQ
jgi:hypothetical protein